MMLFSHDFVTAKLNTDNQEHIQQVESGDHHFQLDSLSIDDVVQSFQHHWQPESSGLRAQSELAEISFELNGFIIAPTTHQIINVKASYDDFDLKGKFKIEFSNQKDQIYYNSNEIDLSRLTSDINLSTLQWTQIQVTDSITSKSSINWIDIGQIDAWVVRFYLDKLDRFKLLSAAVLQHEPKFVDPNDLLNCNHNSFKFPECWINNSMRYHNQNANYQLGLSPLTFNTLAPFSSWLFVGMAWILLVSLIHRLTTAGNEIYYLVTAVFLTVFVTHQQFAAVYFEILSWVLMLTVVVLFWTQRQVFLKPRNNALPVWFLSGLLAMILLSLDQFDHSFLSSLPMYFLWAGVQQLLIGPIFSDKINHHLKTSNLITAAMVGMLFSIIHAPNHMLMLATLVGGVAWSYSWLKYKNIYANAFSHAILALAYSQVMPDAWLGSARIGWFF
jgi:hypothetical protein